MKVIDLENVQLDHWVAKAEGIEVKYTHAGEYWRVMDEPTEIQWIPHKDWTQGGPIIEREGIGFYRAPSPDQPDYGDEPWIASDARDTYTYRGSTPLIAAMRVYVASKYGENLPDL
ncbi:phage protein NinX family protein [Noviherbaspirillum malthae]|uniref:phage protein NinX family protein n=1 Tax=Noviherbaspirillum malthae TaxID=1260987 RepID=UPI00188F091A|nr:phage protein NinX family protein [Noviherbaspirillum malthae]